MNEQKKNKPWALILGGSSGLGLATAKKLAKHGHPIIIVHRDRRADIEQIESDFEEIRAFGNPFTSFNADALHPEKRKNILKSIKEGMSIDASIGVVVHSLAKGSLKPMFSEKGTVLSDTDFRITFDAMALSLYDWTKALINTELLAQDTRIISFTSEGNTRALPGYAAVSVAKVALESLTRNMALEFAPLGIKANCIQAGVTVTKALQLIPGSESIIANALQRNPNNRLTTPIDVANAVYLLTLPEAAWVTGTVLKVDGGESLL